MNYLAVEVWEKKKKKPYNRKQHHGISWRNNQNSRQQVSLFIFAQNGNKYVREWEIREKIKNIKKVDYCNEQLNINYQQQNHLQNLTEKSEESIKIYYRKSSKILKLKIMYTLSIMVRL